MTEPAIDWQKDSRSFDTVAELYETYRPSYPLELVEHIFAVTGALRDGRVLEIGSGTGIATRLFAQYGCSLLCIEQGANLIEVARQKLRDFPRVVFRCSTFEDWVNDEGLFDLVISAQAFHWISKEIRYPKTAQRLKPGGHLAIFWNRYPPLAGPLAAALQQVYREHAPELDTPTPEAYEEGIQRWSTELDESAYFDLLDIQRYPRSERYTAQQYLGVLNTYSDHLRLPEERRQRLFAGVAEVIEQAGGTLEKPYEAVVYIARKRDS